MTIKSATKDNPQEQTSLQLFTREEKLERLNQLLSERKGHLAAEAKYKHLAKQARDKATGVDVDLDKLNEEINSGQTSLMDQPASINTEPPVDADFKVQASGDDSFDDEPSTVVSAEIEVEGNLEEIQQEDSPLLLTGGTEKESAKKPSKPRKTTKAKTSSKKVVGIGKKSKPKKGRA